MRGFVRSQLALALTALMLIASIAIPLATIASNPYTAYAAPFTFPAKGGLDCNGYYGGCGYDNGHYVATMNLP